MFKITKKEFSNLIFHFGISSWGGTRKMPRVFTEHGILMLSSVLKSNRAINVNIQIMRTFVKMREIAFNYKELAKKIEAMERKYDKQFAVVFEAIKELIKHEGSPRKRIGFHGA